MAKIFISHSSRDNSLIQELKDWLADNDHESVFIDFDPEKGIHGGDEWEQELYQKLRQSQAIIACVTQNWIDSKWCFAEIVFARERGKKAIPLILEDCPYPGIFNDTQRIDLTIAKAEGYERLGHSLKDFFDWDSSRIPYPGLASFQEADAGIYFGRDEEILKFNQVLESMRRQKTGDSRILLILGASGSGKSSLVRAGMIPRLKRNDNWMVLDPFRPMTDPVRELAITLSSQYRKSQRSVPWEDIRSDLGTGKRTLGSICIDLLAFYSNREATVLLVVDQAEELFSDEAASNCRLFLDLLSGTLGEFGRQLLILATLRSNFLERFQKGPIINGKMEAPRLGYSTLTLDPINKMQLTEIIERPAEAAGIQLKPDLITTLINDAPDSDTLPLLAFTLNQLWLRYGSRGAITIENYNTIGGVQGSIQRAAQNVIQTEKLSIDDLLRLRALFIPHLIRISADDNYVKRTANINELNATDVTLLDPFVREGLLVTDADISGRTTIEITHEALLVTWPLLSSWITEDRDDLRLFETLRNAARDWAKAERQPELLIHRDQRLEALQRMLAGDRFKVGEQSMESQYLAACLKAQNERMEAKRKNEERQLDDARQIADTQKRLASTRRTWLIVVSIVLVLAITLGILANLLRARSRQTSIALQNTIGLNSKVLSRDYRTLPDALTAAVSAGDSESVFPEDHLDAEEGLTATVSRASQEYTVYGPGTGASVNFVSNGRKMVTSGRDGLISIWDLSKGTKDTSLGKLIPEGTSSYRRFESAEVSSDSRFFVGTYLEGQGIQVWDLDSRSLTIDIELSLAEDDPNSFNKRPIAYCLSRDASYFAASLPDSSILFPHPNNNYTSKLGATHIGVWDLRTKLSDTIAQSHIVTALALSGSGQYLAIGTVDGKIYTWSLALHRVIDSVSCSRNFRKDNKDQAIDQLQFTKNDSTLLSAGDDGILRVWPLKPQFKFGSPRPFPIYTMPSANSETAPLHFQLSPSEQSFTTLHAGVAKLWSIRSGDTASMLNLPNSNIGVTEVVFTGNGRYILTANSDRVRLWDGRKGVYIKELPLTDKYISAIDFLPNGNGLRFATAEYIGTTIWTIYGEGFLDFIGTDLPDNPNDYYLWTSADQTYQFANIGIEKARVSPDKKYLALLDEQNNIKILNAQGSPISGYHFTPGVMEFAKSANYLLTYAAPYDPIYLNDVPNCHKVDSIVISKGEYSLAAISPDGSGAAVFVTKSDSMPAGLEIIGFKSKHATKLKGYLTNIIGLEYSEDGNFLVSAFANGRLELYDLRDNSLAPKMLRDHAPRGTERVHFWQERGCIVALDKDSSISFWDCATGKFERRMKVGGYVLDFNISPDGNSIITAASEKVQIWDFPTGREKGRYIVHDENFVASADFLSDDKIVSVGDETLCIYPISNKLWYREAVRLKNSFK